MGLGARARTTVHQPADEQSNYQAVASATRAIFPLRFSSLRARKSFSTSTAFPLGPRAAMRITAAPKNRKTASLI